MMKQLRLFGMLSIFMMLWGVPQLFAQDGLSYPIVDTNLRYCFDADTVITCGSSFNGQDAQYDGLQPAYQDNGDGTVTDLNTGLMWQQDPGEKMVYADAIAGADSFTLAGYDDWRVPTIKELYSLILFSGMDVSAASTADNSDPFIDDSVFGFEYGNTDNGDRLIDSQWVTSSKYVSTVMGNQECFFGVNFADGRIKCYPTRPGGNNGYFAIYVRGNPNYGINSFVDNGDGTITDNATGLTWMQSDNGNGVLWGDALAYCDSLSLAGADDWRLPNAKELQSIVDYSRSPDTTNSAAIDPLFSATVITNEAGQPDYGFYWSSTTHMGYPSKFSEGAYVSFGRALGNMNGGWIDVHGAGAQRSDDKGGVPAGEENGHGPQGDARRSYNYVRCVRGGTANPSNGADPSTLTLSSDTTAPPPQGQNNSGGGNNQPPQNNNQQQPPEQAFTACNGLAVNASCSMQTPNGTVTGTCQQIQDRVACVPNR